MIRHKFKCHNKTIKPQIISGVPRLKLVLIFKSMKSILVPTDFSTCANNAVDFAIQSSKILPVEVTIVHAFDLIGNTYTDYMGVNKEFNQSLLHEVRNKLAEI